MTAMVRQEQSPRDRACTPFLHGPPPPHIGSRPDGRRTDIPQA